MKNPEFQYPNPVQLPCASQHANRANRPVASSRPWGLRLGASLVLGVWGLGLLLNTNVQAQSYSINWYTIDGGGGTSASTNGAYSISGTVGQPDAGPTMTNGQYAVTGGFWAFAAAVQTPGAPLLRIVASGAGQANISWEPDSPGWVLQETLTLSPAAWTNAPSGATNPIVVPTTTPTKFYRLHKP
jgi:hypothetical protein